MVNKIKKLWQIKYFINFVSIYLKIQYSLKETINYFFDCNLQSKAEYDKKRKEI